MKDLQLRVFKKLDNAASHNVLLIDNAPNKNCPNHWSQVIQFPTYKPNLKIEHKYFLGPLLEWLRCMLGSNIEAMKFATKNSSYLGNFFDVLSILLMDHYSKR